jgi:hypothetical protein
MHVVPRLAVPGREGGDACAQLTFLAFEALDVAFPRRQFAQKAPD